MRSPAAKLVALAVVVAELLSVGVIATSAAADETSRKQIRRQQEVIRQQQREINRLQTQEQSRYQSSRLAGRHETPDYSGDAPTKAVAGLLGFTCPPHYYVNMAYGCLPDLNYIH